MTFHAKQWLYLRQYAISEHVLIVKIVPFLTLCLIVVSDLVVIRPPWILRLGDGM